jgi:hypothetical protein
MSSSPPTSTRKIITNWLDTRGRNFAGPLLSISPPAAAENKKTESPLNALSSAGLALALYPTARKHPRLYPRPTTLLVFSAAFGVSAGMAYEGMYIYLLGGEEGKLIRIRRIHCGCGGDDDGVVGIIFAC